LKFHPPHPLRDEAEALLSEACDKFPMGYRPKIEWRPLRVTAGVAYYNEQRIALSKHVIKTPDQLRETLLHEYAHLLAVHRAGRRGIGHGLHWKRAMTDLGLVPKVHHKYEVKRNQSRQEVVYGCKKCGAEIVRKRRLNAKRRYFHVKCGGVIEFRSLRNAIKTQNCA
jgi:SprT protein